MSSTVKGLIPSSPLVSFSRRLKNINGEPLSSFSNVSNVETTESLKEELPLW